MSVFRGASASSQIITLERMLQEREEELCAAKAYMDAVDEELVLCHLGVASIEDSRATAKEKLHKLIQWHVDVATDPAVNGGYKLEKIGMSNTHPNYQWILLAAQGTPLVFRGKSAMSSQKEWAPLEDLSLTWDEQYEFRIAPRKVTHKKWIVLFPDGTMRGPYREEDYESLVSSYKSVHPNEQVEMRLIEWDAMIEARR